MKGLRVVCGQLKIGIPDAGQLSLPVSCSLERLHLSIKVQPYLLAPLSNLGPRLNTSHRAAQHVLHALCILWWALRK